MKIGFSSLICPKWDLQTIVRSAASHGFAGVELRDLGGGSDQSLVEQLGENPDQTRKLFGDAKVELVCLGTSITLDQKQANKVTGQKNRLGEFIDLADRLGCPFVRFGVGRVQSLDTPRAALSRVASALRSLVPVAARSNVTLLVENGGGFPDSTSAWFLVDAAAHPAVRCCWNQLNALTGRERPTSSLPRLAGKIGMVHVCDALFDDDGVPLSYQPLGKGQAEVARQIELLKGLLYDGYLMFECPKMWVEQLPDREVLLAEVAGFLGECIDKKQELLTAYMSDNNAPKLAARCPSTSPARS